MVTLLCFLNKKIGKIFEKVLATVVKSFFNMKCDSKYIGYATKISGFLAGTAFLTALWYAGEWWGKMHPWYGYTGGKAGRLQTVILLNWVLPLIASVTIVIFAIFTTIYKQKSKWPFFFGYLSLICTFIIFICSCIAVNQATSSKCKQYVADFEYAKDNTFTKKQSNKWQDFISKKTEGKTAEETNKWYEKWKKNTCDGYYTYFDVFFFLQVICLILFVGIQFAQRCIGPQNYQKMDIEVQNDPNF